MYVYTYVLHKNAKSRLVRYAVNNKSAVACNEKEAIGRDDLSFRPLTLKVKGYDRGFSSTYLL